MNILVVTKHLDNYAGSELFTRDLVFWLLKRGHRVTCYAWELGRVSDEMKGIAGVEIVDDLSFLFGRKFDIIHAQHSITALLARAFFPDVPMLFFVHGVLSEFERLPAVGLNVSLCAGVSEEVAENLVALGCVADAGLVKVVRNPVDTARFRPVRSVNASPRKLLILSNHYRTGDRKVIEDACFRSGIEPFHVGFPENPRKDIESQMNEADIVVTLGRGVLEAMACGRNVIVFDRGMGDGFVNLENFYDFRKNNLSGRFSKKRFSEEEFSEEIRRYDPALGERFRELIEQEYAMDATFGSLEEAYRDTIRLHNADFHPGFFGRLLLSKTAAPWYVRFIILENKIKKLFRILGLKKNS